MIGVDALALAAASVALGLAAPPVMDGVERKIRAAVQSRVGPPVMQTVYDIAKLLSKESVAFPSWWAYAAAALSSVACAAAAMASLSLLALDPGPGWLAAFLAFYLAAHSSMGLAPLVVPNPFSVVGGFRELWLSAVNEPAAAVAAAVVVWAAPWRGGPLSKAAAAVALAALAASTYASTRRPPFDLGEAEPELASGVEIELSGPLLALSLYSLLALRAASQMAFAALLSLSALGPGPLALASSLASFPLVWAAYALAGALLGRYRIDLAARDLAKAYAALAVASVALAWLGGVHG